MSNVAPSTLSKPWTEAQASLGGRAASYARRRALSAGKTSLPAASERVRNGLRSAALPIPAIALKMPVSASASAHPAGDSAGAPVTTGATVTAAAASRAAMDPYAGVSGRALSMQRRRQLASGKSSLPAPARVDTRARAGSSGPTSPPSPSPVSTAPVAAPSVPLGAPSGASPARMQARARRALQSEHGRGFAAAAAPSRPPRVGKLDYAAKVIESPTHGGQRVTGLGIAVGSKVTGVEPGATLPVSGTQYIGTDAGAAIRLAGPKVGMVRTPGGTVVSGTLLRSKVRVTGDEAGGSATITGEADQRLDDDLTPRVEHGTHASAQFERMVDPHGASVFGTNLGRGAGSVGSRDRRRVPALESTERGLPITGSAVGRGVRVTGDEAGVCRQVTGDQYLTPANRQAECGGAGGGTAPAAQLVASGGQGAGRRDPVTGAKVGRAETWGGQQVTGTDIEHNPRVTGDAPGSCKIITGTPYQGRLTIHGWCDSEAGDKAEERLPRRAAGAAVTGDTPIHDPDVTGTACGAARDITGTPYYRHGSDTQTAHGIGAQELEEPIAAIAARFTVHSPQLTAHLRSASQRATQAADRGGASAGGAAPSSTPPITGSFAIGQDKVTGNLEFLFRPRLVASADTAGAAAAPAHTRLTGEGRTKGSRISGNAWSSNSRVTGTEGATAMERNASERAGKPQAFSGAMRFKAEANQEEPKQLVTGMFGWSSKSGAKVTLSGGAHG